MSLVTGKRKAIDPRTEARLEDAGKKRSAARHQADLAENELRAVVLEALDTGASVRVIAEIAGIAPVTVSKWKADR